MSPFRVEGPAVIAFSGGRTSGLMLYRILEAWDGALPMNVVPVFCNTGKEDEATLRFVDECSARWGVLIRWVEYRQADAPADRWREVTYETASRAGEPFEAVIRNKRMLPNPRTRFCTSELKIKASMRFAKVVLGFGGEYVRCVGLRADEPRRVANGRERYESGKDGKAGEPVYPLYTAGVTVDDVRAFWASQPFDLGLPIAPNGTTPTGNCDLCFLKGAGKIASIIAMSPDRAVWWAAQERYAETNFMTRTAGDSWRFSLHRPSYSEMLRQGVMFGGEDDEDALDCACTD